MAELARFLKESHPSTRLSSSGPCIAKKAEVRKKEVGKYIDYAITFEELQALFDSRDIILREQETEWNQASYYGRILPGRADWLPRGYAGAEGTGRSDFTFDPVVCDGIDKCKQALTRADKGVLPNQLY